MEYMPGDTLGGLIKAKPYLSESEAKQIAKKLLQGVAIMHSRDIAHRDLKPSVRATLSASLSIHQVPCR